LKLLIKIHDKLSSNAALFSVEIGNDSVAHAFDRGMQDIHRRYPHGKLRIEWSSIRGAETLRGYRDQHGQLFIVQ